VFKDVFLSISFDIMPVQTITRKEGVPASKIDLYRFKFETERIEKEWDHHGSYQWTYFVEEQKRLVNFFLSKRAGPRNLEIGGGWYQSYPDSTAIDISAVCLKYNEAKKKLQFNLDFVANGFHLPFKDCSFDSATMISVWQYLENPVALLKELERVLAPGGEVYIINGDGAGLEEFVKSATSAKAILETAMKCGYGAMLQTIPTMDGERDTFKSVCIAMPDNTLFGPVSHVEKKGKRINNTRGFLDAYAEWELGKIMDRLLRLNNYPVTKYSRHYLKECERLSQEFHEKTGRSPILFAESHQLEVDMLVKGGFIMNHELTMDDGPGKESFGDFARPFGIGFGGYHSSSLSDPIKHFLEGKDILPEIRSDYECRRDSVIHTLAGFIASIPLNSHTKSLQQSLLEKIWEEERDTVGTADREKHRKPTVKEKIARARARRLYSLCYEYKQRRRIDEFIKIKGRLNGAEVAGEAVLDTSTELPYFNKFILEVPMDCSYD
jgi:SAM-dependent methyltransferase